MCWEHGERAAVRDRAWKGTVVENGSKKKRDTDSVTLRSKRLVLSNAIETADAPEKSLICF